MTAEEGRPHWKALGSQELHFEREQRQRGQWIGRLQRGVIEAMPWLADSLKCG